MLQNFEISPMIDMPHAHHGWYWWAVTLALSALMLTFAANLRRIQHAGSDASTRTGLKLLVVGCAMALYLHALAKIPNDDIRIFFACMIATCLLCFGGLVALYWRQKVLRHVLILFCMLGCYISYLHYHAYNLIIGWANSGFTHAGTVSSLSRFEAVDKTVSEHDIEVSELFLGDLDFLRIPVYLSIGDSAKALEKINALPDVDKYRPERDYYAAEALFALGRTADALVSLDKAMAVKSSVEFLVLRAGIESRLGDQPKALADIQKAIVLDGKNPAVYIRRGCIYMCGMRDYKKALEDFTPANSTGAVSGEGYMLSGIAYLESKYYENASRAFTKVAADRYLSAIPWQALVALRQRHEADAKALYAQAEKRNPKIMEQVAGLAQIGFLPKDVADDFERLAH
jgi:tetratricopeptide (TPR) repeat protein